METLGLRQGTYFDNQVICYNGNSYRVAISYLADGYVRQVDKVLELTPLCSDRAHNIADAD